MLQERYFKDSLLHSFKMIFVLSYSEIAPQKLNMFLIRFLWLILEV